MEGQVGSCSRIIKNEIGVHRKRNRKTDRILRFVANLDTHLERDEHTD